MLLWPLSLQPVVLAPLVSAEIVAVAELPVVEFVLEVVQFVVVRSAHSLNIAVSVGVLFDIRLFGLGINQPRGMIEIPYMELVVPVFPHLRTIQSSGHTVFVDFAVEPDKFAQSADTQFDLYNHLPEGEGNLLSSNIHPFRSRGLNSLFHQYITHSHLLLPRHRN